MDDLEMMAGDTVAAYKPEKMIIRLSPEVRGFNDNGTAFEFQNSAHLGVFLHEYFHYLHNISTASGLAGFFNMLERWRLFRETFDQTGFSTGQIGLDLHWHRHYKTLIDLFKDVRCPNKPTPEKIVGPVSLEIVNANLITKLKGEAGILLCVIECDAKIKDASSAEENIIINIGVQEVMESAAWLLEHRLISSHTDYEHDLSVPVFPYKVVSALIKYKLPNVEDDAALAFVLAALNSTDPADALWSILQLAESTAGLDQSVYETAHIAANNVFIQNKVALLAQITKVENEFVHNNIMAIGIRAIMSEARNALEIRESEPFYEIRIVDSLVSGEQTINNVMANLPACIVLQEELGLDEDIQRDSLVLLRQNITHSDDTETGLRVVYAIFDFVERHIGPNGFVATLQTEQRRCPFYTTCGKRLRRIKPLTCQESPWKSADWDDWGLAAICEYAKAVKITRPPESK